MSTVPQIVLTSATSIREHVVHVLLESTKLNVILIVQVAVLEHVTRKLACAMGVIWDCLVMHVI